MLSLPATVSASLGTLAILLLFERARPLRPPTQSLRARLGITVAFAVTSLAIVAIAYPLFVLPAAELARAHGIGLLRVARVSSPVQTALSFVLLDYSLWLWHWMNHRVPLLWRFHAAHHADLDLDALTAWRFHLGEMLASVPFRVAQVLAIGVDLRTLLVWELAVLLCAQAHHANVRLPTRAEAILRFLVITPRLHGIHHAIDPRDLGSNFGTLLSVWDHLHGRHRFREAPAFPMGLPETRDPRALTWARALALPCHREAFARTGLPENRT